MSAGKEAIQSMIKMYEERVKNLSLLLSVIPDNIPEEADMALFQIALMLEEREAIK